MKKLFVAIALTGSLIAGTILLLSGNTKAKKIGNN